MLTLNTRARGCWRSSYATGDGKLRPVDVDAHTKTHDLEEKTHDDGFGLVEKNARMRLKRDGGWVCSWI